MIVLLLKAFDEMKTSAMSGAVATANSIPSALMLSQLLYGVFNAYSIVLTIVNTVRIKREGKFVTFPGSRL